MAAPGWGWTPMPPALRPQRPVLGDALAGVWGQPWRAAVPSAAAPVPQVPVTPAPAPAAWAPAPQQPMNFAQWWQQQRGEYVPAAQQAIDQLIAQRGPRATWARLSNTPWEDVWSAEGRYLLSSRDAKEDQRPLRDTVLPKNATPPPEIGELGNRIGRLHGAVRAIAADVAALKKMRKG